MLAREFTPEALAESVLSLLSSEERRVAIGTQAAAFVQRYLAAGVTSPRVAASILYATVRK